MKSVGDILKDKRLELGQSIEDVHRQTKIQKEFIEAIETNNLNHIANSTTAKGFIRNYAVFLGLSPENILAIFRRDYTENQTGAILSRSILHPPIDQRPWWTPKTTLLVFIVISILVIGGYFGRQYYRLSTGPDLSLELPNSGQIVTDKVIVKGKTSPDAVVKVQGMFIAINDKGEFNEEMVLPRGDNILTVESTDRKGKTKMVKVRVRVE